jgi:hypothetical protein
MASFHSALSIVPALETDSAAISLENSETVKTQFWGCLLKKGGGGGRETGKTAVNIRYSLYSCSHLLINLKLY